MSEPVSVLFVCLGNICRSPMAEGIFQNLAKQPEVGGRIGRIDSCGTGVFELGMEKEAILLTVAIAAYHSGEPPDDRTMATLEANGITDYDHLARRVCCHPPLSTQSAAVHNLRLTNVGLQFHPSDFNKFDYIFAMDRSNLSDLHRLQKNNPDSKAKVMLFGEFSGTKRPEIVNDPYYGGNEGFSKAFEQCSRFSKNFLKEILEEE